MFIPTAPPLPYMQAPPEWEAPQPNIDIIYQAVLKSKTEWVKKASIPKDDLVNQYVHKIDKNLRQFFYRINPFDNAAKEPHEAKLWNKAGKLILNSKMGQPVKNNPDILNFIRSKDLNDEIFCFNQALQRGLNSYKTYFNKGRAHFLYEQYPESANSFSEALALLDQVTGSEKYQKETKALILACRAACFERLSMTDSALLDYLSASQLTGLREYEENLSRVYHILQSKPNKTDNELKACIECDPTNPDFSLDLAENLFRNSHYLEGIQYLSEASYKAFYHNPYSFFRISQIYYNFARTMTGT